MNIRLGPSCSIGVFLCTLGLSPARGEPLDIERAARSQHEVVPAEPWPTRKQVYDPHREAPDHAPNLRWVLPSVADVQGGPVVFGPYTSIQVNVNALGNNIVGDAANEPSMAISPVDASRIVIGWRQFDSIGNSFREAGYAYSSNHGQDWTAGVLTNNIFRSDPIIAADGFGNFFYSSLTQLANGTFRVDIFRSANGGLTWSAPVNSFGGDKQWMIVDERSSGAGAGHLYQNWNVQFTCCPPGDFTRSIDGGVSFQSPIAIPQPSMKWGTLDTDQDGILYLAGATLDQQGHLVARSSDAMNPAVTPTFDFVEPIDLGGFTGGFGGFSGPNPAGLLGQVWVAAHPTKAGHLYVLGSVAPASSDPQEVMFTRSTDGGLTWTAPLRVNDDPIGTNAWQWFGALSIAPNGRLDATWNDTRTTGVANQSAVFYSFSLDEGDTWSANVQVSPVFNSHLGFPQQNKIGDYTHMVSDNGGANLAYSATFNGEEDVYFLRIPRDCNGNGIDDHCDVACGPSGSQCDVVGCGQSQDCNADAIPDECQPSDDCNGNQQADVCEIGADPGLDCNGNLILDQCESPLDCNENMTNDVCDIASGSSQDCNENLLPDECDIDSGASNDRDGNGIPDECVGACCACSGCLTIRETQCLLDGGTFDGLGSICADIGPCESSIPENDHCEQALQLAGEPTIDLDFDNTCATSSEPASVDCPSSQPFGTDLWYHYVAPCNGTLRVGMCGQTNFDAILAVYGGDVSCACPESATPALVCGDDTCGVGGGPPLVDLSVLGGRCYTIRAGGWSGSTGTGNLDLTYLTQCTGSSGAQPEPGDPTKNRFISFIVPSQLAGSSRALRVRLTSLHHPPDPPDAPDFSSFEGQFRYVNTYRDGADNVVLDCPDSLVFGNTYKCARLGCNPEYRDWAAELGGEVLHVTGNAVVPSSLYDVSILPASCTGQEAICPSASTSLSVSTSRWGDILPGTLDVIDVASVVDKVKDLPLAVYEPQALIHFGEPTPRTEAVNVLDISHSVDALKNFEYPFGISACP